MQVDNLSQAAIQPVKIGKTPTLQLGEKTNRVTLVQRRLLGIVEALVLTQNLGERLKIIYMEPEKTIKASVLDEDGQETPILRENMPKELRLINNALAFQTFLQEAYFKTSSVGNGEACLYVEQRDNRGERTSGPTFFDTDSITEDLARETMKLIKESQKELAQKKIKEKTILFVGRSGSGKSLLCNFLNGVNISGIHGANGTLAFDLTTPIMPVNHSPMRSCTTVPGAYSPIDKDYTYVDLAGFSDTKGAVQDIVNAFTRVEVIKQVKALKIVIVVPFPDLYMRGRDFPNALVELMQFIGCCKDEEGRKKIVDSTTLVVTKVKAQKGREDFEEEIKELLEDKREFLKNEVKWTNQIKIVDAKIQRKQEELRQLREMRSPFQEVKQYLSTYLEGGFLPEETREILRYIIDKEKFTLFSAPRREGTSGREEEKEKILELIHRKSRYISTPEANTQVKFPLAHAEVIRRAITYYHSSLKRHFSSKLLNEIQASFFAVFFNFSSDQISIKKLSTSLQNILKTPASLANYVLNIHEKLELSQKILNKARQHNSVLEFLTSSLPPDEQSLYPSELNWCADLSYPTQFDAWESLFEVAKVKATAHTTSDGQVTFKGGFVRTSQIKEELSKRSPQKIKDIEIYALYAVILDEDLPDLKGINLTIIAPFWQITQERKINLTGGNEEDHNPDNAPHGQGDGGHGTNGLPGLPGKSGGNFFGVDDVFVGLEKLTIISNGGRGGKRQNGGHGAHGKNGMDAIVKATFEGWDHYGPECKTGKYTTDQLCESYGIAGTPGGNAGAGGQGGLGGLAGAAEIISLSNRMLKYYAETNNGSNGQGGMAGTAGQGGYNGRKASGTWHRGGTPNNGWSQIPGGQPQLRGAPVPPVVGKVPTELNSEGLQQPEVVNFDVNFKLLAYISYLEEQLEEAPALLSPAMHSFYNKFKSNLTLQGKGTTLAPSEEGVVECLSGEKI
ncbi:hypothetical protein [Parachlamydia sp. AcF125]|uniref:hypothetical protein n=1 Tax=Parachlamydia sp. AcF125 TaxID=2795736 RepID=UPI001BC9C68C|nr:hypothetical protein [Parachlamydia sp. AcF125]MBS4168573.1 hypothetical protein [Parachlamydia sp. AcF125]